MTYDEFVAHIISFSWREDDDELAAAIDGIILMAGDELVTLLQLEDLHGVDTVEITNLTGLDLQLPADYHSMREVSEASLIRDELLYESPGSLRRRRITSNNNSWAPWYSIAGDKLLVAGPYSQLTEPYQFVIDYNQRLPDYKGTGASWFADQYLHIYTMACLKYVGLWAREEERIAMFDGLLTKAVEDANIDSAMHKRIGKFGDMPLATVAGVHHSGGNRRVRGSYKTRGNT